MTSQALLTEPAESAVRAVPHRHLHPLTAAPEQAPTGDLTLGDCSGALFAWRGSPGGVAASSDGAVWISGSRSGTIWRLAPDGSVSTVIPPRSERGGGMGSPMPLGPVGIAESPDGTLYVADRSGHRICAVAPDGEARVVAGGAQGFRDGPADEAMFRHPSDVAFGPDGGCYVADSGNNRIRRIGPDGVVTTVAGSIYDYADGKGATARFRWPGGLDVAADGTCYVADTGNNSVRRVDRDGTVRTVAGAPLGGDSDGVGRSVELRWPTGIAAAPHGVYVADHGNGVVRHVDHDGVSETTFRLAGPRWPVALALRPDGAILVAGSALSGVECRPDACVVALEDPR